MTGFFMKCNTGLNWVKTKFENPNLQNLATHRKIKASQSVYKGCFSTKALKQYDISESCYKAITSKILKNKILAVAY